MRTSCPGMSYLFATLTNVLFVVLVLGMPIIMMNMLVGLAVGDIDKIQQNALMDRYVLQVQLLLDIENSMPMFILKHIQVHGYRVSEPSQITQNKVGGCARVVW
ncbi:hypothetical protein OS493_025114 [Desmophyllum pertusum]|uniref:Ion transport domain-containing protein n=1 Tax=Desmophyllum pertusum TaxID=174260 RepID=A0A9X0CDY4_9CNID|nr:hypothetical protein OS493_025114 [Desmophyllum pertusum]